MDKRKPRTAAATHDLRQACAAGRRRRVAAAKGETAEVVAAAIQRAEQGCAVFRVARGDRLPAAVTEGRGVGGIRVCCQQQPCGLPGPAVPADLHTRRPLTGRLWSAIAYCDVQQDDLPRIGTNTDAHVCGCERCAGAGSMRWAAWPESNAGLRWPCLQVPGGVFPCSQQHEAQGHDRAHARPEKRGRAVAAAAGVGASPRRRTPHHLQ